jgi:D-alanyl-D-alanine carboxypeptidase
MSKRGIALLAAMCLVLFPVRVAAVEVIVEEEAEETLAFLQLEEDVPAAPVIAGIAEPLPAKSAILLEQSTGNVLFEQNSDELLPPASVTKVMTLLLVM